MELPLGQVKLRKWRKNRMCGPGQQNQGMTPNNGNAGTPFTGGANAFLAARQKQLVASNPTQVTSNAPEPIYDSPQTTPNQPQVASTQAQVTPQSPVAQNQITSPDGFGSTTSILHQTPAIAAIPTPKTGDKVNDFITAMGPAAQKAAQQLNVSPNAILAHWAYESGWGKSGLSQKANNYGGIKALPGQDYVSMPTSEKNGTEHITANFRRFTSPEEYGQNYVKLLQNKRYRGALNTSDPVAFATGLGNGGYHQDSVSGYANNIGRLANIIDQRQSAM